ncbi:hypothetical protein LOK49_LG14G00354 [Camellia lanceoleosa]|uniref:Uncharacterized protein n=1 Tax=Camellia lanceoleosa TaxID=1840588 RepID=A0ACC0F9A4_9ERIC|nr:hypothetical protein LOK49_LG14G00354 [Camellia lanceoleosa]
MSKLPRASHFTSLLHRSFSKSPSPIKPCRFSNSQPHLQSLPNPHRHRNLTIRAFVSSSETKKDEKEKEFKSSTASAKSEGENGSARSSDEEYPSGEFEFKEFGEWKKFGVKLWMLVAFPWERIPNGTVLTMKLRGQVDKMEEVAQGRVWTGKEVVSRGLVDAIGGFSRAVAIAKQKTNIPRGILNVKITLLELSRPSPTLLEILVGISNIVVGVDRTLQELLQDLASSDEIQAWMDGIMFQKLDGVSNSSPFFTLIKDYLSSL